MKMVRLGEIAEFVRGVTFKPNDTLDDGTGVPVMRTKNVQAQLDLSDVIRIPANLVKNESKYLRYGDTLISSANSWNLVGKCSWVPELSEPTAIGGFVTALRPDSSTVSPRYIYHWFSTPLIQSVVRSFGNRTTSISNLSMKRCLQLDLPLPPLDEQRRIAAILDKADGIRQKRRQAIAHLDALSQSIFESRFHHIPVDTKLADVVEGFRNGVSPSSTGSIDANVLTLSAITQGIFDESQVKSAKFNKSPGPEKRVSHLDLLICRGNGNKRLVGVGESSPQDLPELTFPDTVIAARIQPSLVLMDYLKEAWRSTQTREQIESKARTTNGTYKINQRALAETLIRLPPISAQRRFQQQIRSISAARRSNLQSMFADEKLFASLQSRAFRGEL